MSHKISKLVYFGDDETIREFTFKVSRCIERIQRNGAFPYHQHHGRLRYHLHVPRQNQFQILIICGTSLQIGFSITIRQKVIFFQLLSISGQQHHFPSVITELRELIFSFCKSRPKRKTQFSVHKCTYMV